MAEKNETILLDYKTGPGLAKVRQELKGVKDDQNEIAKALLATNKQALTTEKAIEGVVTELTQLARQKAVDQLSKNFVALEKQTGSTNVALKELAADLVAIGASDDEIRKVTRSIADMADESERAGGASSKVNLGGGFGRATADVRGLLGTAGAGNLGVATDILDLTESLPKLKEAITDIPQFIGNAAQALGPAGIAVVAVIGAVALSLNKMNADLEPLRQNLDATLVANRKYSEFLASGATTEQVEARIKELEKAAQQEQGIVDNQTRAMDTAFEYSQKTAGDFLTRLAFAVGDADDKVSASTEEARGKLLEYNAEISRLKAGLQEGATATNDAEAAEAELTKRREEAAEKITALETQRLAILEQFNDQSKTIDVDRRIREERAAIDLDELLETQETQHQDRMGAIADAGQQRLEQIKAQGNDRLAQADVQLSKLQQSLADVTTKLNTDRSRIDREFMASERAAVEKFRQEEEKADAANKKARLRRLQDLGDELLDAEQANDVVAFIAAKRAGEKDLKRMAEDADAATKQRQADFEAERAIAEQRHQERIADLEAQANERRADIQQQIQERQVARDELVKDIKEQLDTEKQRIIDTQKAEQVAFDAQQARDEAARDKRNQRQAEDEALADSRRRAARDKQIADINTKITAEQNAAQIVGNAWNNMAYQVGQIVGGLVSNIAARASTATSSGSSGGSTGGQAFATGGIVTRPTIAKLGERPGYHEAAIPFRPSEGIEGAIARLGIGGRSAPILNFNAPISVGDGVSEATLVDGLHQMAGILIEGFDRVMRS